MAMMYAGKDVDDMTRDELIETIEELGRLLNRTNAEHSDTLDKIASFVTQQTK